MVDFAVQRANMVESQVRPSDVTDRRIPRAMLEVSREIFVPAPLRPLAYMDDPLKIANGRHLLAPRVFAKMLQYLEVGPEDTVLDVGCGTGYGAAVLAKLAKTVTGLECDRALAEQAVSNLSAIGIGNVKIEIGPLPSGFQGRAPYDAILVEGAITDAPAALLDQLKDGGRLVAVLVDGNVGNAALWCRFGMQYDHRVLFDAGAAVLPGFEKQVGFVF